MRIIAIVGIWNFPREYQPLWQHFETAFTEEFPGSHFFLEQEWFSFWEKSRIRHFSDRIVEKYDDGGKEILLLGYSMGGVIAAAIAPRFRNTPVRKVVTVWSPHTFLGGLFSRMCGSTLGALPAPILSCQSRFDWFVPWGSKYPNATRHIIVPCDHLFSLLWSKKPANLIARAAADM